MAKMQDRGRLYRRIIMSTRWRNVRNAYIVAYPLCEDCLEADRTTAATEVHHIDPIENYQGDEAQMWRKALDVSNLRALCKECHFEAHRVLMSNSREANRKRVDQRVSSFAKKFGLDQP